MSGNPEILKGGVESTAELEKAAGEQLEKLTSKESGVEKGGEDSLERADAARKDTEAIFAKEAGKEKSKKEPVGNSPRAVRKVTKHEKEISYRKTMKLVRSDMGPVSRTFSKVIHQPAIEKTSQVVGGTVARPNAILTGSIFAFVFVLATYVIAREYGYPLSGFETMGAFLLGWIIGLIFDYAKLIFRSRR